MRVAELMVATWGALGVVACGGDDGPASRDTGPGAPPVPAGVVPQTISCEPSSGTVYHVSLAGDDEATGTPAAPWRTVTRGVATLSPGDTLYVEEGVYEEQVVVTQSGAEDAPILISSAPGGGKAEINGQGVPLDEGGLVSIVGASHVKLCSLTIRQSANHGVSVQDDDDGNVPSDVSIVGLSVFDSDDAGIYVEDADTVVIEANVTRESVTSGIGVWYSNDVVVRNNEVVNARNDDDRGHEEWISIAGVCDFEVANNELYMEEPTFDGHTGIDAKESSCRGSIHHNYIHDFPGYGGQIYLDAWEAGLDGTGSLSWIDVYANRLDTAGGITVGSEEGGTVEHVRIFNNSIYHPWTAGIQISDVNQDGPKNDIQIFNNTIWGTRNHGTSGIYLLSANITDVGVRNNVVVMDPERVVGLITAGSDSVLEGLTVDHNVVSGPTECSHDYPACVEVSTWEGNQTADPLLVDGEGRDLHLGEGSPAIDRGVEIDGLTTDFDGIARPQGRGFDVGAFEFQP